MPVAADAARPAVASAAWEPTASLTAPLTPALAPVATRPKAAKAKKGARKTARAAGARAARARAAGRGRARERRATAAPRRRAAAPERVALAVPAVEVPEVTVASPAAARVALVTGVPMAAETATSADASWEAMLTRVAAAAAPGEPRSEAASGPSGPLAALSRSATSLLDGLVVRARSQLGTRYVYGGAAPGAGLDCSAFVRYVMEALDVRLPRTANQQARVGRAVPRDPAQLRPGDLLTFGRGRHTSHVGIYLGEGRFIHASVKSGRVIETTLDRNRGLFRRWQGARRLLAGADGAGASGG